MNDVGTPPKTDLGALSISIVVNVEEGAEMSIADGDLNPEPIDEIGSSLHGKRRNFSNESNYRYGLRDGFERIGSLLNDLHLPATWTCAALALERATHIAEFIRERGDEAASHGYRWVHQFRMTEDDERRFIASARDSIANSVGTAPVGHLSRYFTSPRTRELLVQEGFLYHMDDYSRDEPFWDTTPSGPIVVVPYAVDTNDMKMWQAPGLTPRAWEEYLVDTFDQLYRERCRDAIRLMSVGLHLRISGRPARAAALRRFLEYACSHDDVRWVTRRQVAEEFGRRNAAPKSSARVSTPR